MKLKIVNRKYLIGGKWFRYQRMIGVKDLGFKIVIGKYEFRFYKTKQNDRRRKSRGSAGQG